MHMTTSKSRRLKMVCIKFKIIEIFIATLFEGWHFTDTWKTLASQPHHFTKSGD